MSEQKPGPCHECGSRERFEVSVSQWCSPAWAVHCNCPVYRRHYLMASFNSRKAAEEWIEEARREPEPPTEAERLASLEERVARLERVLTGIGQVFP